MVSTFLTARLSTVLKATLSVSKGRRRGFAALHFVASLRGKLPELPEFQNLKVNFGSF
jgi:hypothetical protein